MFHGIRQIPDAAARFWQLCQNTLFWLCRGGQFQFRQFPKTQKTGSQKRDNPSVTYGKLCESPHHFSGLKFVDESPIFRREKTQVSASFWRHLRACFGGKMWASVEWKNERVWSKKSKGVLRGSQTGFKLDFLTGFLGLFWLHPPHPPAPSQIRGKKGFGLERSV